MSAPSEYYDWGGIAPYEASRPQAYPGPVPAQDSAAAPVDEDRDGSLLEAARAEHRFNLEPGAMPYRDSVAPELDRLLGWKNFRYWLQANTFTRLPEINRAGIPAYETANFGEDLRVKQGVMVKLHNVTAPMKLIFAPGRHCNWTSEYKPIPANPFDVTTEELRWFDYWLKGVRNGILDEPPIFYYTYNTGPDEAWKFAWQWPLPNQKTVNYYFGTPTDMPAGPRREGLTTAAPRGARAADEYRVDYTVTPASRDAKGMTYTTPVLAADTTVTGHPVARLWISSAATDGDFLAFLEDIGPDGSVTPLPGTDDGQLRASHRALNAPPYDNLGLPYHRSFAADVKPLTPGRPTELAFELAPLSWVFKAGHRIRIVISCVAVPRPGGPALTPALLPPPIVSFYRDAAHPSYVAMPVAAEMTPRVRLVRTAAGLTAYLAFPREMDARYLKDIAPASVRHDGVTARSVRADGHMLIARFAPAGLKAGAPVTIRGAFGRTYFYGALMRFAATGAVAAR
jgi:predicted acyl esterase